MTAQFSSLHEVSPRKQQQAPNILSPKRAGGKKSKVFPEDIIPLSLRNQALAQEMTQKSDTERDSALLAKTSNNMILESPKY